jgi:hypothetical protein
MRFRQLFARSAKHSRPRRPAPQPRKHWRPHLEALEDLVMPSITLNSGVLEVACDTAREQQGTNILHLYVDGNGNIAVDILDGNALTYQERGTFDPAQVTWIDLDGSAAGNDYFVINQTLATTSVYINPNSGGGPNDRVQIGYNLELIQGGVQIVDPNGTISLEVYDSEGSSTTGYLSTFFPGAGQITGFGLGGAIRYNYSETSSVFVETPGGAGTNAIVNVLATGTATEIDTGGIFLPLPSLEVNVGSEGSVQDIQGNLSIHTVFGYLHPNTTLVTIDDSADTAPRGNITLGTLNSSTGYVRNLSPAEIDYDYGATTSVHVLTGHGGDTVNVQGTGTTTDIVSDDLTTVNVTDHGYVENILGTLNIENPPSLTTIVVDDSNGSQLVTWGFGRFINPEDSEHNLDAWGQIHGLAPAAINYEYVDTERITVKGPVIQSVYVGANGALTNLVGNGMMAVHVGNAGSLADITAPLYIDNTVAGATMLSINGSADTAVEQVTLESSSTVSSAATWGAILFAPSPVAPEPAPIYYDNAATASVSLATSAAAGDTIDVLATGVPTQLQLNGAGTVDVGAGSLAGILAPVTVTNSQPSATTLRVDGSQDTFTENVAVAHSTGGGTGKIIAILATPVATTVQVGYDYASTANVTVCTSWAAGDEIDALAIGVPTTLQGYGPTTVDVGKGSLGGIVAPVTVANKQAGATTLMVDDSADTRPETAILQTANPTTQTEEIVVAQASAAAAVITYLDAAMASVSLATSDSAGDTIDVLQTGVPTNLHPPAPIFVQVGLGSVQGIRGVLNIQGVVTKGTDIWIDDSADPSPQTVTLSTFTPTSGPAPWGTITGLAPAAINYQYASAKSLWLKASSANDTFVVNALPPQPCYLAAPSGTADTLVGPNTANTWLVSGAGVGTLNKTFAFSGMTNLVGGSSNDTFKFLANGSVPGTVNGGGGSNTVDFSGTGGIAVMVNLQTSAATAIHGGAPGGFFSIKKFVGSTSTANTLIGPSATNLWQITGPNAGSVDGFTFAGFGHLVGGPGVDTFAMHPAGSVLSLSGGGAPAGMGDWLSYAAFTTPVTVNLTTGSATNVGGGAAGAVQGIPDVRGGAGDNTLIGGGGNIFIGGGGSNTLIDAYTGTAAAGRSLLIGGTGMSNLTAGSAGDILVAGTTSYDGNFAALMSILAEWQSADSYATRFHDINTGTGGGLNGKNRLFWGTTVKDNDGAGVLTGGGPAAGLDWFFANYPGGNDTINNFDAPGDEYLNNGI